jgi:hypothetical protein
MFISYKNIFYIPALSIKKCKSIQFMTQIFIKMSVNDAPVKKQRNQQIVLSEFYFRCYYKMGYYLILDFLKIKMIFGGYFNFSFLYSYYVILLYFMVYFCAVNSITIFRDVLDLDILLITVTFSYYICL